MHRSCVQWGGRTPVILALVAGLGPLAMAAPGCAVKTKVPSSARIFARAGMQSDWHEFHSLQELPPLDPSGGMSAQFWQDRSHSKSVYLIEPGQDFWIATRYCFDGEGNLEGVGFEIRTALGWGHRAEGSVSGSGFDVRTSEFFNLKNGKQVVRPDGVADVPRALKPILYMKQSELPFAALLPAATAQKKHRQ